MEYEAHTAVISGLVETLETLRRRNNGRYPTKDRITQEVVLSAVVKEAKGKVLRAVARLLKVRPQTLQKAAGIALHCKLLVKSLQPKSRQGQ